MAAEGAFWRPQHALRAAVLASLWSGIAGSYAHPKRWIVVSQPGQGTVSYVALPRGGGLRSTPNTSLSVLIAGDGANGSSEPMGLAVDQARGRLFVADPGKRQVVAYTLDYSSDPTYLGVSSPTVWASNVEARWVAVDSSGDIILSDEGANKILTVPLDQAERGDTTPRLLYDGASAAAVSAPGGVASDGVNVYWVNKKLGTQQGSLVAAPKAPSSQLAEDGIWRIATDSDKSYGVCLVTKNAFYTQAENSIHGVDLVRGGGVSATVSNRLGSPRGCAFDGDGTVYVADRTAGALYSFAGNMQVLGFAAMTKSAELPDAFGVAIFSRAARGAGGRPAATAAALAAAAMAAVWFAFGGAA